MNWFGSILVLLCLLLANLLQAQVRVSGTVYEMNKLFPMGSVSVLTSSGKGTVTDSSGRYSIVVNEKDSIYFSYLGKATPKYAVNSIQSLSQFDISLHVNVTTLREIRVMPKDYRIDSMQNRQDYAKVFDYKKPGLALSSANPASGNFGVGLDINELINMFRFRRNRSMAAFQDRLLAEEQDKYVAYRFSRAKIIKITGITGPDLDTFYRYYAPPYEAVVAASEYELLEYMKKAGEQYKRIRAMGGKISG
ncbi:MAG: carboxypeptidase-like regulatory domain-containing protein, partial [Flavihumibacter sp.]|nr:carboxypeptidase-like regulatory domain-containing protein [Flavihumibacter sp.]